MTRLQLLRNLRTLVYLAVLGGLLAGAGFVVWANHTGLPALWRTGIENELAKHGINARIGSLSLNLLRGIVAKDVTLFTDPERTHEFCRFERLLVNVDKTKIARGQVNVTKVEITKANLSLRIEPTTGPAETLEITDLGGTLLMPGGRLIEVRNTRANVAGFDVTLGARMLKSRPTGEPPTEDVGKEARLLLITQIIRELRDWRFAPDAPPTLRCFIEGDLSDWSTLVARVALKAREAGKNGHLIDQVSADGSLSGSFLSLTSVQATDRHGTFHGRVDFDVYGREGRFDVNSSVNLPLLLQSWTGVAVLQEVVFGGSQLIESEGSFRLRADGPPLVRLTGWARCADLRIKDVPFQTAEGSFAWQDDQFYVRDVVLRRADGQATGKVMIQWPQVRLALQTTLPVPVYRPFFKDQPLEAVLNDFGELPKASVEVSLEGGFDATDHRSWAFTGHGRVKNVTFRGVPVDRAECNLALSHDELDFTKGTAIFNFRDYSQRKAHGGPASGTLKVARVRFDGPSKMVEVTGVTGNAWVAPVVRTFAAPVADMLEIYRFRRPPALEASGVVDVTHQNRTALTVSFSSKDAADYVLLGKELTLEHPSATVEIRGPKVTVSDLEAEVFGGPVKARITVTPEKRIRCEASWTELSMQAINDTYGFRMNGGGLLTGRAELDFTEGRIDTLAGHGLAMLEESVLFSAPVLGPLSGLVAAVLNDERAGFERAKDAFLTFTIKDGILQTKDFHTSTPSLVFAADGSVDLIKLTLDANVRVNARGLLGIVTFPLRPFSGLFQFRGSGPLSNPQWIKATVTAPPPEQEGALLQPPRARILDGVPRVLPLRKR